MSSQRNSSTVLSAGFSLMELLIAIAIIAVLLSIGLPVYNNYTNKAKFSELLQAVGPYKTAANIVVQLGASELSELDTSNSGIPDPVRADNEYYKYVESVDLVDGVITAQARGINSDSEPNYILRGSIRNGLLIWELDASSTCLQQNLCQQ